MIQLDYLAEDLGVMGDQIVREMFAGIDSYLVVGEEPLDVEEDKPEVEEPDKINEGIGEEPKVEGEREKEGVNTLPILPESPTKKQTARGKVVDILISWDIIEGFTVCSVMEKYQRCPNDLAGSGTVSRWWQEGIKVERIISLQENRRSIILLVSKPKY